MKADLVIGDRRLLQLERRPDPEDMETHRRKCESGYHDTEDHGWMHVTFEDGTIADVIAGEIVLGGLYNYVEVFANNHRTRCRRRNRQRDQYAQHSSTQKR